jgi:ribosomal protein S18 acetylase RimI-like enzyme
VWIDRVGAAANATFICAHNGEACGIVILIRDHDDGLLVGMWVAPAVRGDGAGDSLIVALLAWADAQGISTVRLHVVETNAAAQRLYARHGFRRVGPTFVNPQDGQIDIEMQRLGPRLSP